MRRSALLVLALLALGIGACRHRPIHAPAVLSREPVPASGFTAGFGRVDITPPPGPGLMGYGTEGARSRGHRMRLYARSLVVRDASGELLALVAVDLGQVSGLLQREVAMRIESTGIGADRLIISATHTHSGPGHFFGSPAYDEQGSSVEGFDSLVVAKLAGGIAQSVRNAYRALEPARIVWGSVPIWGRTRVRNDAAVRRNAPRFLSPATPPAGVPLRDVYRFVDPELHMLRVDHVRNGRREPAGTYMIFPVHGTVIPAGSDLFDGDLQAIVTQLLEQATGTIDELDGAPSVIHLLANGAEGDIVADFSADTRCAAPAPVMAHEVEGPRRNVPRQRMRSASKPAMPECAAKARVESVVLARSIAASALELYRQLGAAEPESAPVVRRAFTTLRVDRDDPAGLCRPHVGPATMGGGEGGYSRVMNIPGLRTIAGVDTVPLPLDARADPERCQGVKPKLDFFEGLAAGTHPYPEEVQLTVAQLGARVLATVPGEPTTNAGAQLRRALSPANTPAADSYRRNLVIGLANGYAHYLTTEAEYSAQLYEGAATIYGPRATRVLAERLGALAQALRDSPQRSPRAEVTPLLAGHRGNDEIWPRPRAAPPIGERRARVRIAGDTVVARWRDELPGNIQLAGNLLIELQRLESDGRATRVAWDDDPRVEVRLLSADRRDAGWEARFAEVPSGRYRIVLRARSGVARDEGHWFEVRH